MENDLDYSAILPLTFYEASPKNVAQKLIGKVLVRNLNGVCLAGRIVETEAYLATGDPAAHGFGGLTNRNSIILAVPDMLTFIV